jgi:nitrile hydratase accessory protein
LSATDDAAIAPLARMDGEPVFDAAWQAEVLGLAYALTQAGLFTPAEWSQALGGAHRHLLHGGAADVAETYYRAALAALEELIATRGALTDSLVAARIEQWRRAYLNTPHGQPVLLAAGRER